jgi:hypothetical protein
MSDKRILIVHPYDKTTSFLERIKSRLILEFKDDVHYFSIKPNNDSHYKCLERIRSHPADGLIIFLGHGRSDKLFGSKANEYSPLVSLDAMEEFPEKYYYNENFINENNIEVFAGKKVFCLACNSNDKIAKDAIDKGANTFLGFGDIPTSTDEFQEMHENISTDLVRMMKTELVYIIKICLTIGIKNKLTFERLLNLIHFVTNQRLTDILINKKHFKDRYILADNLYYFKKNAIIRGEETLKLLE